MQGFLTSAITAGQLESSVSASKPVINQDELKQRVQNWISKQGKHWPSDLDADALTNNLKMIHLPYWVVSGNGSAQWSASIGVERQVQKRCGTCGGRGRYTPIWSTDERRCDNCAGTGQALGPETFWSSQSGIVEAETNNQVRENFDSKALNLKCGNREFKVDSFRIDSNQINAYNIIAPYSSNSISGENMSQLAVENALQSKARSIASGLGAVRDLQMVNVQTNNLQAEIWLYPMYLGYYSAGDEQIPIQVDGITKKLWAEVPSDVKSLRRKDRIRWIAYGITTLLFLVPRVAGIYGLLFQTLRWVGSEISAFDTWIWPILGLIFLPWTTLMYAMIAPGGILQWEWLFLILAVVIDIGAYTIGYKQAKR